MAFTSNNNLKLDPQNQRNGQQVVLRDQRHASKTFVTDQFRLAPKSNFLFHVAFSINVAALKNSNIVQRHGKEINMLVKSIDLPQFKINIETLNQYNRTKVVQYRHTPQELGVKFHDDNMGLINEVWQNYYSYYYADSTSAKNAGAYNRTATRNSNFIKTPYGFDNGSTTPFFNSITIYQMARHEYVSYKLINPIITSWNHNKLDYGQTGVHDFDMKLAYEAVSYGNGVVTEGDPEGFGFIDHYDTDKSPLVGPNPDPAVSQPSFTRALDTTGLAASVLNNALATASTYQQNQTDTNPGGGVVKTVGAIGVGVAAFGIGSKLLGALGSGSLGLPGISISGIGDAIGGALNNVTAAISSGIESVFGADPTQQVLDATTAEEAAQFAQNAADSFAGSGVASDLDNFPG